MGFGLWSCNDSCSECDTINSDYIVFGHFYGLCWGEGCIEIFKIEDSRLYEDTKDEYPGRDDFYQGQFDTKLSDEKFQLVKDLESYFPEGLLDETVTVLGHPDEADGGGIYFEIRRGATHRFWFLDQMDYTMPAVYNEFVDRINEKITLIHQ